MKPEEPPEEGATTPAISVIVANYNAAPYLADCLRSILAQEMSDLEVILVDDVSSDDSMAIACEIAATDARVRVFQRETNGGPAASRNTAISLARGRWLAIVDSDDLLHPRRFAKLLEAAEAAGVDMVADDLLVFQDGSAAEPKRFLAKSDHRAPFLMDLETYLRRSVLYGPEPDPGFLKPLIRRVRLQATAVQYDETLRIAEDSDLMIRLLLAGLTYLIVPMPWYFYRKHDRSISHRLTMAAVEAMRAAEVTLASSVVARHPRLAEPLRARQRSLDRAAAFEQLIATLKARRPFTAAALAVRHPAMLPMLRMPLIGIARRLFIRAEPGTLSVDAQQRALLAIARSAGG